MNRVGGFDYFSDKSIKELRPFFYQALTEMGYYGYDLDAFKKYLKHVDNPIFTFTLSKEMESPFNRRTFAMKSRNLSAKKQRILYISTGNTIPGRPPQ